jgi:hypothetical protein
MIFMDLLFAGFIAFAMMLGVEKILGLFHSTMSDPWYYLIGLVVFLVLLLPFRKTKPYTNNNDLFPGM